MNSRLELHNKLLTFCPNVYFQPPSSITMVYPCIVYTKISKLKLYGSDVAHVTKQEYRLTIMDKNPDSLISDQIQDSLEYCTEYQRLTVTNINHTFLTLFY